MSDLRLPNLLFGLPLTLECADGRQLTEELTELWIRQMGKPPGVLDFDLDALHTIFDPLARGARLRRLLSELPPVPTIRSSMLRSPIVLGGDSELIVTPEGRVALAILSEHLKQDTSSEIHISQKTVCAAEHQVYDRYRRWSNRRLEDVLRLQTGAGQALSLPSIAFLLLLLINRSHSFQTALRLLPNDEAQNRLDAAIGHIINAFWDALTVRKRESRPFSLYSGYPVTEARRRLPEALSLEADVVYILPGGEERVFALVAAELRRPHRKPKTEEVLEAFDRLVTAYRNELPTLAAFGMAHEQRAETRQLRHRLEQTLDNPS